MIDEYSNDDEQVEALKRWWDENGRSLLLTLGLALGAVFGWQYWQSSQQSAREDTSAQYQALVDKLSATEKPDATELTTLNYMGNELKEQNKGSVYAHFAAMQLAKLNVDNGELPAAREQLQWVLDNKPPEQAIAALARLRLARVTFAESGAQPALAVINNVETGPYRADYAEFRGDLYNDLGEFDKAAEYYGQAMDSATSLEGGDNRLLEMKLKSVNRQLGTSAAGAAASVEGTVEGAVEGAIDAAANAANDASSAVEQATEKAKDAVKAAAGDAVDAASEG